MTGWTVGQLDSLTGNTSRPLSHHKSNELAEELGVSSRTIQEWTFATLDEVLQLTAVEIPQNNLALRRDRAAVAMLYLSGMRAGAFISLSLEAVDLNSRAIKQWPSLGVRTKNHKYAMTYLLEIPELLAVVEEWDAFVRANLPLSAAWYTPVVSR